MLKARDMNATWQNEQKESAFKERNEDKQKQHTNNTQTHNYTCNQRNKLANKQTHGKHNSNERKSANM